MKTKTIIILAIVFVTITIVFKVWYHNSSRPGMSTKDGSAVSSDIKRKDDNTIRYYNSNKTLIHQMLDSLKLLHDRYSGYEPIIIAHRNKGLSVFLTFVFANKVREERIFYNFVYSSDNEDSCEGPIEIEHRCHNFSDSTGDAREDSCKSCSKSEKNMINAFIRDSCLWHGIGLVKRAGIEGMRVEKDGFRIVMDGPSILEHGEGDYAFMYIPYSKKLSPDKEMNVTATIDSEVYLYHTRRN